MARTRDAIAQLQRRTIFKEIGRELNKLYAPLSEQQMPEDMATLLAMLHAKTNASP